MKNFTALFRDQAFTKPISEVEADALVRLIWNGKDVAKRIFKQCVEKTGNIQTGRGNLPACVRFTTRTMQPPWGGASYVRCPTTKRSQIGRHQPKIERLSSRYPYPEPKPKDYRDWFSVLGTDFVIQCPSRNVSNIFAGHGLPVYWYNYDHAWDVKGLWGPNMTFCEGHACHGGELPFVFNSANKTTAVRLKPAENMLASQMSRAWAAFASTGSPNHNNAGAGPVLSPSWPEHSTASALGYAFRTPGSAVVAHERAPFCDLWDELGYVFN